MAKMSREETLRVLDEYIAPRLDQIGAVFLDPDVRHADRAHSRSRPKVNCW